MDETPATTPILLTQREQKTEILQINHRKPQNPINAEIHFALRAALQRADADPDVEAIVITGGKGRSFSVGGDFEEVAALKTQESVSAWIERVLESYIAVLAVSKPVVMAVGGYAIGMGLQLALMGDWRVAGEESQISMWELKKGIACTVGACILQRCLGRLAATRLIYGCELLSGRQALTLGLVDDLASEQSMEMLAIERAEQLAAYPTTAFSRTKRAINAPFIEDLRRCAPISCDAHTEAFQSGGADAHLRSILAGSRAGRKV